ncbi:GNAT family N-acetyltransferase [Tumebacillus flagellatus]|uniref:Acetyltransferase n=1 Tax=Tumebacillus flagellatus TaxID=1157490 RepID=A0A074M4H3_9BACL|nr:GNAT family N-acetyltransferase [Tumebacillus flagellatus]KEO80907.1 acetyltransferase [Tumebacillus flagellatus]
MNDTVQSICYNYASDALRREIALLLHRIWPDDSLMTCGTIPTTHDETLNARSFLSYVDGQLVSYAGVVHKTINHSGQTFNIAGLSCVATDPDYHGQGFGMRTVAAATRWIGEPGDTDIGLFTCEPSLAYFYKRAGDWPVVPDVKLIGSCDEGALSSDSLQVVVLMRLFSAKAHAYESMLRHTTIDLDLPVGKFL